MISKMGWRFWCVILLMLAGCATSDGINNADIQLTELRADYNKLQDRYQAMRLQMVGLDEKIEAQAFLEPQVIVETVKFEQSGETLDRVQDRGNVRCGTNASALGFGYLYAESGQFAGFDIDFCRAVGAAIFGSGGADAIRILPLTSRRRFSALQSGEIDVLIRNTTWTLTRDVALGFSFGPTTFYDGQGMMVSIDSGIDELEGLVGKTICVTSGTTSEQNVGNYFASIEIEAKIAPFDDIISMRDAYDNGDCVGITGDKSALMSHKVQLNEPESHKILDEEMSREPLTPLTRHGDNNWDDVIFWVVQCTINAEYLGINQDNVQRFLESENLNIQKLLGTAGELGEILGLRNDFCYQVIDQVGNYADIYSRHLGLDSQFNLQRGINALFIDGGILYPVPFK